MTDSKLFKLKVRFTKNTDDDGTVDVETAVH